MSPEYIRALYANAGPVDNKISGRARFVNGRMVLEEEKKEESKKGSGDQGFLSSLISEFGGAGGALGGAATGAALGSVVPGLGNIVGGIVGGVAGGFAGGTGGRLIENQVRDNEFRLGDALKEGTVSGIFGGIGPAWQGARGLQYLGKAGGGGISTGAKALGGLSDDAAKIAAGKAISRGGKKAAQSLVTGATRKNALQAAGQGIRGNSQGVGVGAKAPGLENLGAGQSDELIRVLQKEGIPATNPEKALRTLEPILSKRGKEIAAVYANSGKKITTTQLKNLSDDILKTLADDPSVNISKAAQSQVKRQIDLLKKVKTPEELWKFQKDLGKSINFGKTASSKLVDREAVARVMRSKIGTVLDDVVVDAKPLRSSYGTLKQADLLMRVASKQADKTGLVARVATSAPVRSLESKSGTVLEKAGNIGANRAVSESGRLARGMAARGIANQMGGGMQPVVQDPTQEEQPQGITPAEFYAQMYGEDPTQQTAPTGGGQPQSAYSLQQAIADIQADPENMKDYINFYEFANQGGEAGLSDLTDGAVLKITDADKALIGIEEIGQMLEGADFAGGVIGGNVRQFNPFDATFKSQQATIDRVRQIVGKALEGGVLRKEDEEKYKKILPTMQDPEETVQAKLTQLHAMITQDRENYIRNQQQIGGGGAGLSQFLAQ